MDTAAPISNRPSPCPTNPALFRDNDNKRLVVLHIVLLPGRFMAYTVLDMFHLVSGERA